MLDKRDQTIIDILHTDANLSTYQIAKKTAIPQTTVLNRIRKLRESGIIKRYTLDLDWKKLELATKVLIFVKVDKNAEQKTNKVGEIEKRISLYPNVLSVKRLMGRHDFVIELVCRDIDALNEFLIQRIRVLPQVADTETVVVLEEWKKLA